MTQRQLGMIMESIAKHTRYKEVTRSVYGLSLTYLTFAE